MEWATIGLLDAGDDAKMQWNTRGITMQEAQGVRERERTSELFLRMVRDGDGSLRAYWKKEAKDSWSPAEPAVHFEFETIQVR